VPALLLVALIVGGVLWWRRRKKPPSPGGDRGNPPATLADLVADKWPEVKSLPLGPPAPLGRGTPPLEGQIVVSGLTKRYGDVLAVDEVSFVVQPGRVTGFLGPNGAGKTTTLRMLLGLVAPSEGTATIGGLRYGDMPRPIRQVGAVLEASAAHKGRTGRDHLRILCRAGGVPLARADEVLPLVGLAAAARRPFRGYSLGMRQRLGIAAALLGNPPVLVLDEPANGLDPEGVRWMRELLQALAAQGRTILVSSHQLSEMQILADDLVIIAAGKLVAAGTVASIVDSMAGVNRTLVRANDLDKLTVALAGDAVLNPRADGGVYITGVDATAIGEAAHRAGVVLHQLTTERPDLEDVFLKLTSSKAAIR
jgi:ABC-2 type transport system ATP-binding protein